MQMYRNEQLLEEKGGGPLSSRQCGSLVSSIIVSSIKVIAIIDDTMQVVFKCCGNDVREAIYFGGITGFRI